MPGMVGVVAQLSCCARKKCTTRGDNPASHAQLLLVAGLIGNLAGVQNSGEGNSDVALLIAAGGAHVRNPPLPIALAAIVHDVDGAGVGNQHLAVGAHFRCDL